MAFSAMMFLIRKDDGLLVVDKPAGSSIDISLLWELDITPPTISQLESMTAKSLESFPRQMGWKIVNATSGGKKSLASHVLKSWDVYKDRAMSASSFVMPLNMRREKGKLYFFENSMGMFPMVVKSGQILTHTYLANYSAGLDMEMINTLTVSELKWCLSQTFGMYMGGSLTTLRKELDDAYASYLEEMVSSHVVAVPIASDEELSCEDGSEQLQEDEEICDDESVLEVEIANVNYLYGFVAKMDFSTYVSSTVDFYSDSLVDVDFYNHSNEKLFSFPTSLGMTVGELKHEFCIRVQAKQRESGIDDSDERFMTVDMFTISSQRFKMADMESLDEVDNNRVYFHIRQSGGARNPKMTKKDLLKKSAGAVKERLELFKSLKSPEVKLDIIKAKVMTIIKNNDENEIMKLLEKQATPTLLTLLQGMKVHNAEVKTTAITRALFHDDVKTLDSLASMINEVKSTMDAVSQMLFYKKYTSESGVVNWQKFTKDINDILMQNTGGKIEDLESGMEDRLNLKCLHFKITHPLGNFFTIHLKITRPLGNFIKNVIFS